MRPGPAGCRGLECLPDAEAAAAAPPSGVGKPHTVTLGWVKRGEWDELAWGISVQLAPWHTAQLGEAREDHDKATFGVAPRTAWSVTACLVCEVRPPVGAGVVHRAAAGAWRAGQGCSKEALEMGRAFHLCPAEMFPEASAAQGMPENQVDRKAPSVGSDTPHQDPRPSPSVLPAAGTWPQAPHQAGPPGLSSGIAAGAHLTRRAPLNLPCPAPAHTSVNRPLMPPVSEPTG